MLREELLQNPERNMSWCRPYILKAAQHRMRFAVNEGKICFLQLDGEDMDAEQAAYAAAICGIKVAGYDTPLDALLDHPRCKETGCAHCPCFCDCDAFSE